MKKSETSVLPLLFDLYLKPSLLVIGIYQIVVTGTFTAQQLLIAAYLDQLGLILISGIILAVFFLLWFILGPICGTLSDKYGRKLFMISGNFISFIGFIGLVIFPEPLILFGMNALLGFGSALRIGSVLALWVQHSPKNRVGESLAYINILIGIGGVGGVIIGFLLWTTIKQLSFLLFGILLFLSAIPIFLLTDSGEYAPFSLVALLESLRSIIREKSQQNFFFFTKPMIQLSIHWFAFSTIVSFGTFIIPIFERIIGQLPPETEFPFYLLFIIVMCFLLSCIGGLLIWGKASDKWARKPVLIIGFIGTSILVFLAGFLIHFNLLYLVIDGLITNNPLSFVIIMILLILIFTTVSLIPTPLAWIVDLIGKENVGKAMSLRQALIALGTMIGTIIGGFIIGFFGVNGLLVAIFIFLVISAVILL
ncbi:MAG: MFS transporter [Candidatus Hodarchaeota archaeon]